MKVGALEANIYWKRQLLVAALMGFSMAVGYIINNYVVLTSALVVGVIVSIYLRQQVREPLQDERSQVISTKSSVATLWTTIVGAGILGGILLYLGTTTSPEWLLWGYNLAVVAVAILIVRAGFWVYYSWRHGGRLVMKTKLKVFRAMRDMTQDDVAQAVGVTRQTIIAIERGNYNPSLELAFKIANYFDVTIEEIFLYKE